MKEYLSQKGVKFTEYDVSTNREKAIEMVQKSHQMGVPVISIDEEIVIGFDRAKLDKLLS